MPTWPPTEAGQRTSYGELISRYEDLPPALAHRLTHAEITGAVFDLKLRDVIPARGAAQLVSGELYDTFQKQLDSLGANPTPLDVLLTGMRLKGLPLSMRMTCAQLAAPYVHQKNPAPPPDPDKRGVLVVGTTTREEWEAMSQAHYNELERRIKAERQKAGK